MHAQRFVSEPEPVASGRCPYKKLNLFGAATSACAMCVCVSAVKRIESKAEVTRVDSHKLTQLPVSHARDDGEIESDYLNKMMKTHAPHNLPLTS